MPGILLLAVRYMGFHRGRTTILVLSMAVTVFIPMVTHVAIGRFQSHMMKRAESTPLVIGTKGSRFGLAIHGLYFRGDPPSSMPQSEWQKIEQSKLAQAIPLHSRFRAGGFPIVGTTADYIRYRELAIAQGHSWQRWGDCMLGSNVASRLGLGPNDRLLSEPENAFDLSGPSPLNMRVVGVFRTTGTADDEAVFVDIKTAWILEGLGHGHAVKSEAPDEHLHDAGRENLSKYNEVTEENVRSFHFHGNKQEFPLTAILAIPDSAKSEAILVGKFLDPQETTQVLRPKDVIAELLSVIAHLRQLMNWIVIALALVEMLLLVLVILLSLRLRAREMETMRLLGCSRGTMAWIVAIELALAASASVGIAMLSAWATERYAIAWMESFVA
jgi:putative ABC transport system permease protein